VALKPEIWVTSRHSIESAYSTTAIALAMDMSGMSSTMPMSMGTATSSAAMPAATDADMGGMGGMGDGCKISVCMASLIINERADLDVTDAVELEHDRLL
jgi:hypothetical protein